MSPAPEQPSETQTALSETVRLAVASGVNFLISLARTKLQAWVWGPAALGVLGLMQASMSTATLVVGVGVDGVIARDLAATSDVVQRERIVAAGLRGMVVLAAIGSVLSWLVFTLFASALGFLDWSDSGLVAIAGGLAVVVANQRAVIAGARRAPELAKATNISALVSLLMVALLVLLPASPLAYALVVLAVPAAQFMLFRPLSRAVERYERYGWRAAVVEAVNFARRSQILALAGILPVLTQLLVRAEARKFLTADAFGSFQASMSLAAISVSVLASSVAPSVLPRLSAQASDPVKFPVAVNETIATYLTLYAPIVLVIATAPSVIVAILFSGRFSQASGQLSFQLMGEVLRLPCWVLATALTARGRFRAYFLVELVNVIASVLAVWLAGPTHDLRVLGLALSGASLVQFIVLTRFLKADQVEVKKTILLRLLALLLCVALGASFGAHPLGTLAMAALAAIAVLNALKLVRQLF